jgi:hypothetical protein
MFPQPTTRTFNDPELPSILCVPSIVFRQITWIYQAPVIPQTNCTYYELRTRRSTPTRSRTATLKATHSLPDPCFPPPSERLLTDDRGLPNRPWFEHPLYAPGFYTGYGVKTIPAFAKPSMQKKWPEANEQIQRVSAALEHETDLLKQATKLLPANPAR